MARINLLPWRAEQRKQRQQEFVATVVFFVVLALAVVGAGHFYMSSEISRQQARNEILKKEIKEVEKRITEIEAIEKKKQQLVDRMKVIERLQQGRPEIVHVFDEMVRATPEGIFLTNLTQKGNVITIEGMSQSNARVSQMMRSLDSSDWFENPSLFIVTKEKAAKEAESDNRKFRLIVPQTPLEKTLAATQAKTQQGPSGETQPTAPAGEDTPQSSSGGDQAAAPSAENAVSPKKTAPTNQR